MWISILPDELLRRILEIGISSSSESSSDRRLDYRDLCRLSIASKRLNQLISGDHSLWRSLLSSDFNLEEDPIPPPPLSQPTPSKKPHFTSSFKTLYRIRFERERDQRRMAHMRAVLRIESEIAVSSKKIDTLELQSADERKKLRIALAELNNLHKASQASVALRVWQPEVIRDKHKQMVQQCGVTIGSRISALEMEVRLCKQLIANYELALKAEKRKLVTAKEKLESVKYHPLHDLHFSFKDNGIGEHSTRRKKG